MRKSNASFFGLSQNFFGKIWLQNHKCETKSFFIGTVTVDTSFFGRTYLPTRELKFAFEGDIFTKTKRPEQYKEYIDTDLFREIGEFGVGIAVFDDMSDYNRRAIDPFFRGTFHKKLDVYYVSKSYFDSPGRFIKNNSNIICLYKQTFKNF